MVHMDTLVYHTVHHSASHSAPQCTSLCHTCVQLQHSNSLEAADAALMTCCGVCVLSTHSRALLHKHIPVAPHTHTDPGVLDVSHLHNHTHLLHRSSPDTPHGRVSYRREGYRIVWYGILWYGTLGFQVCLTLFGRWTLTK